MEPTLTECWRDPVNPAGRTERCYDIFGSTVPRAGTRRLDAKVGITTFIVLKETRPTIIIR